MKKLVTGLLAHVDAGKTTLSEGLLYLGGEIRKLGRVDHGDAFLETNELENERGITIFSKQAIHKTKDLDVFWQIQQIVSLPHPFYACDIYEQG